MATVRWRGDAKAVAQVDTATVGGTVEVGDLFIITINGKSLSVAATTTNPTTTATDIVTAFNAADATIYPEFSRITASSSTVTVTLTADDEGVPFTATYSTTESNGGAADAQTFSGSTATAATGPNYWSDATNWSGGAVPVNSDDVYIEDSAVDILYGLAQSAVTLTSLNIAQTFTGRIGLPRTNADGYIEYRAEYLAINSTTVNVGRGEGSGSPQIKLNLGSAAATVNVINTGSSDDPNNKALQIKGTHASNVVNVIAGQVAIAPQAGETSTVATLRLVNGDVFCGAGVTLSTTIEIAGGTLTTQSAAATVNQRGGTWTHLAGALTTGNFDGGTCYYISNGTATTVVIGSGAVVDCTKDNRARTFTNCTLYEGGSLLDPQKTITATNNFIFSRCAYDSRLVNLGENVTLARS